MQNILRFCAQKDYAHLVTMRKVSCHPSPYANKLSELELMSFMSLCAPRARQWDEALSENASIEMTARQVGTGGG